MTNSDLTNPDERMRLFTAVELPREWKKAIAGLQSEIEKIAPETFRWVKPELMHLTLVFLGDQRAFVLPDLESAFSSAATGAARFTLSLGTPGSFGSPQEVRVVWAGLRALPPELQQLRDRVAANLDERKVVFDHKPLVPHITLGRGRRQMDRNASLRAHAAIPQLKLPETSPVEISSFVLMRSHLDRSGPEYEVLQRFELGG